MQWEGLQEGFTGWGPKAPSLRVDSYFGGKVKVSQSNLVAFSPIRLTDFYSSVLPFQPFLTKRLPAAKSRLSNYEVIKFLADIYGSAQASQIADCNDKIFISAFNVSSKTGIVSLWDKQGNLISSFGLGERIRDYDKDIIKGQWSADFNTLGRCLESFSDDYVTLGLNRQSSNRYIAETSIPSFVNDIGELELTATLSLSSLGQSYVGGYSISGFYLRPVIALPYILYPSAKLWLERIFIGFLNVEDKTYLTFGRYDDFERNLIEWDTLNQDVQVKINVRKGVAIGKYKSSGPWQEFPEPVIANAPFLDGIINSYCYMKGVILEGMKFVMTPSITYRGGVINKGSFGILCPNNIGVKSYKATGIGRHVPTNDDNFIASSGIADGSYGGYSLSHKINGKLDDDISSFSGTIIEGRHYGSSDKGFFKEVDGWKDLQPPFAFDNLPITTALKEDIISFKASDRPGRGYSGIDLDTVNIIVNKGGVDTTIVNNGIVIAGWTYTIQLIYPNTYSFVLYPTAGLDDGFTYSVKVRMADNNGNWMDWFIWSFVIANNEDGLKYSFFKRPYEMATR